MVKWLEQRDDANGTTYIGRNTDGRKIKVWAANNGRIKPRFWQWDAKRKVWIEKVNAAHGRGKLPTKSDHASDIKAVTAETMERNRNREWTEQISGRDRLYDALTGETGYMHRHLSDWQSIRKTKAGYVTASPEHTKRGKKTTVSQMRGQRGNKGTAGTL